MTGRLGRKLKLLPRSIDSESFQPKSLHLLIIWYNQF